MTSIFKLAITTILLCSTQKVMANASSNQQPEPELAFTIFRGDFTRPSYGRHKATSRENLQAIPAPQFRSMFFGDAPESPFNDADSSIESSVLVSPRKMKQFGDMPEDFDTRLGVSQVLFSKPEVKGGNKVARGIPQVPPQPKVDSAGFTSPLTLLLRRIEDIENSKPSARPAGRSFRLQNDEASLQERVGRLFPERPQEIETEAPAINRPSPGPVTITRSNSAGSKRGRPVNASSGTDGEEKLSQEGSTRRRGSQSRTLKTSRTRTTPEPTEEESTRSQETTKRPSGRLIQGRRRAGSARQRKPAKKTTEEEPTENPKNLEEARDSIQADESNDESAPETGSDFGAKIRA